MNIHRDAWVKVAQEHRNNGTGLSMELVNELRDRQRNSFAVMTFSEKVELEMIKNGDTHEAKWCRLM